MVTTNATLTQSQQVSIQSVDLIGHTATGLTRQGNYLTIDTRYLVGAVHVVPAVREQWFVKRLGQNWALDAKMPYADDTLANVADDPTPGLMQLGSSIGPTLLLGEVLKAGAALRLLSAPTGGRPAAADAGAGAILWNSDTTRIEVSDGTDWQPTTVSLPASAISDSTTVGRALLTAVNAAGARSAIGADGLNMAGTYASRPAAGVAGRVYHCTDCDSVYLDSGSAWTRIKLGQGGVGAPLGDVPTTGWTAVNMLGTSSFAASLDGMLFTGSTSQTSIGYQYRTYPASPFTLTVEVEATYFNYANMPVDADISVGGGLAISNGTKYITLGPWAINPSTTDPPWGVGLSWYAGASYYNNATTLNSIYNTYHSPLVQLGSMAKWFRYIDDGTNRIMQLSINGIDWNTLVTEGRTVKMTPTRIGIFGMQDAGDSDGLFRIRSWNGVP